MRFFNDLIKGFVNCFKAFQFIFDKGLWPYIFFPIIAWLLMWAGSIWIFAKIATYIASYINSLLNAENIPDSGSVLSFLKPFLTGYFSVIIAWILKLLFWFMSGTFSKYITLIILSPIFSKLSEETEQKINQTNYPFNFSQFIKDIGRGILISIRNMLIEYFYLAICFIITLIFPPLAIVTTPLLILISWYYTGFTMLDYNFERHKMSISQSSVFIKKNAGLACGIGLVYSLFMLLPLFLGIMFGPILAVVGATISFLEIKKSNNKIEN